MKLIKSEVQLPVADSVMYGNLNLVEGAKSIIIFAHGSGSGRFSKRNNFVADQLHTAGFSTLLFDLLTTEEDQIDQYTREFRFDIPLLAQRLMLVTKWITDNENTSDLAIGYFGSSTGAAAALIAAAHEKELVKAVVSRGGRVDLAGKHLENVTAATLLIVGELDYEVLRLNQDAYNKLTSKRELAIVPQATHLFEEEGALEEVARLAADWFNNHMKK